MCCFCQGLRTKSVQRGTAGKVHTVSNVKALQTEGKSPRVASYHEDIPSVARHKVSPISISEQSRGNNRSFQQTLVGEKGDKALIGLNNCVGGYI